MNMSGFAPSSNFHFPSLYLSDWDFLDVQDFDGNSIDSWMSDRSTLPDTKSPSQAAKTAKPLPSETPTPEHQLFLAEFSDPETAELAGELFIDATSVQDALDIAQDYAHQWGIAIFSLVAATEKQIRLHRLRTAF